MRVGGEQLYLVMSDAYDRLVPADHYLRKVSAAFDFSFIDKLCDLFAMNETRTRLQVYRISGCNGC